MNIVFYLCDYIATGIATCLVDPDGSQHVATVGDKLGITVWNNSLALVGSAKYTQQHVVVN